MHYLHMSYEDVMKTPMLNVSMFISESTPRPEKKDKLEENEVELETYFGKVKAVKKFII